MAFRVKTSSDGKGTIRFFSQVVPALPCKRSPGIANNIIVQSEVSHVADRFLNKPSKRPCRHLSHMKNTAALSRPVTCQGKKSCFLRRESPVRPDTLLLQPDSGRNPYICNPKVFDIPEQTFDFRLSRLTDVRATGHAKGSSVTCVLTFHFVAH